MSLKTFATIDILSITTQTTLSKDRINNQGEIIKHMVDDPSMRIIRMLMLAPKIRESIHTQLPWTKDLTLPELPQNASKAEIQKIKEAFVAQAEEKHGKKHDLAPLTEKEKQIPEGSFSSRPTLRTVQQGGGRG